MPDPCEDCSGRDCPDCGTHYCAAPCDCDRSHPRPCECRAHDHRMTYAD